MQEISFNEQVCKKFGIDNWNKGNSEKRGCENVLSMTPGSVLNP